MYTNNAGETFYTLIVEDSEEFNAALGTALCQDFPEMEIGSALSGEVAAEKLGARAPDMILMDVRLPGVKGIPLTRHLKSHGNQSMILVFSSKDLDEYRQAAIENGADYFISKSDPLFMVEVLARVQEAYISAPRH